MTAAPPASPGTKCDRCSRLYNGRWTRCTCPDGPVRVPIPKAWKRGSGT